MEIVEVTYPQDLVEVRCLFDEYAASLGVDLSYQGFGKELSGLPGAYARPRGRLLLAKVEGEAAACVALRPLDEKACEMKRLFVRPGFQKRGLARALCERLIIEAREAGYTSMVLDTLPSMSGALRLYETLGFVRRAPYYDTPIEETVFMEREL